jgi:hypothetical protein
MHKWLYVGLEERTKYELSKSVYLMGEASTARLPH